VYSERSVNCGIKKILSYIFTLGVLCGLGQTAKIDSLKAMVATAADDTVKVKKLNSLIWQLKNIGEFQEALKYGARSKELAEKLHFKRGLADVYINLGVVHKHMGNYPVSLEYLLTSLRYAEELRSEKSVSDVLSNIGNLYHVQANYDKALEYQLKALKIREQIFASSDKRTNKLAIANSLGNIGIIYTDMRQTKIAKTYHARSLKLLKEVGGNRVGEANAHNNIASCLEGEDSLELALKYYKEAVSIYTEENYLSGVGTALGNIANVYIRLKNYKAAEEYALKSLAVVKEIGDLDSQKETDLALSRIYEQTGKHERSLLYYKAYIAARDSLLNEENTKQTVRLEMNYEFEKKEAAAKLEQEKKEAIAAAERKKQRVILLAISVFGIFVLAFALFAYRSYLQKKKANHEITKQKELIEEKQKEIVDSIHYARRIQTALLPHEKYIARMLKGLSNK